VSLVVELLVFSSQCTSTKDFQQTIQTKLLVQVQHWLVQVERSLLFLLNCFLLVIRQCHVSIVHLCLGHRHSCITKVHWFHNLRIGHLSQECWVSFIASTQLLVIQGEHIQVLSSTFRTNFVVLDQTNFNHCSQHFSSHCLRNAHCC